MSKDELLSYYSQYTDPNNEKYSDHLWYNGILTQYLNEL